jgi:hypothetical protein
MRRLVGRRRWRRLGRTRRRRCSSRRGGRSSFARRRSRWALKIDYRIHEHGGAGGEVAACEAARRVRGVHLRVRVEIMGSPKSRNVGESQSVLAIMIDPMISTRSRQPRVRLCSVAAVAAAARHAALGVAAPGAGGAAGSMYARRFHPWRCILTEIYLYHTCSCHEILRMKTPGQGGAAGACWRPGCSLSTSTSSGARW